MTTFQALSLAHVSSWVDPTTFSGFICRNFHKTGVSPSSNIPIINVKLVNWVITDNVVIALLKVDKIYGPLCPDVCPPKLEPMTTQIQNSNHRQRRRISNRFENRGGLSLLELLVVLTILIALGGIVVSTLPGMLKRTQVATAASNIPEIDATIRRSGVLSQGRIGNRFDSLISGTASLDGSVPGFVGGNEFLEATNLSPAEVEALRQVGVTELVPASADTTNATFSSHEQLPVELGSDTRVCMISNDVAFDVLREGWNFEPAQGAKYLVFGLGQQSSLVGAGEQAAFSEAPMHYSDDREQTPKEMYSRYLLLVELKSRSESEAVARYIGAAIPGRNGIHSVSKELKNYYTDQN